MAVLGGTPLMDAINSGLNGVGAGFTNALNGLGSVDWSNYQTMSNQFSSNEAALARDFNKEEAEKARNFNSYEARIAREWQERMSNTAYQRTVEDLRKAGLNPYLAYEQGGASTPGGATASGSGASGASATATSPNTLDAVLGLLLLALQSNEAMADANRVEKHESSTGGTHGGAGGEIEKPDWHPVYGNAKHR